MLNVGFTTYQKWEQGKRKPRACYRRQIGEVFQEILLALDLIASENAMPGGDDQETITTTAVTLVGDPQPPLISEHAETNGIVASSEDVDAPDRFIARNMTMYLWNLTYANHLPCSEKPDAIRQAIKDFDTMNIELFPLTEHW